MMTLMKKFGRTLTSLVLSPTSIKMTTLSTCALHNTLPCLALLHLFPYMATLWNQKGGVKVKDPSCPLDPLSLSVASSTESDGNETLIKLCYLWRLKSQTLLTFPIAPKIHLTVSPLFFKMYLHTNSMLQDLILERQLLEHDGITINPRKKGAAKNTLHPHQNP